MTRTQYNTGGMHKTHTPRLIRAPSTQKEAHNDTKPSQSHGVLLVHM